MAVGLLAAGAAAAALRGAGVAWKEGAAWARGVADGVRPSLRFYLEEPAWWHPGWSLRSIARTATCALLVSFCARTLARMVDPENSFALGLWLGCAAAALLLWVCALGAGGALGLWFVAWWLRTWRRRARCRRIVRATGWPRIALSPRLLDFSDRTWGRLPPYDHFATTPWCTQWRHGELAPLSLYAALALIEDLEKPPAGSEDREEPAAADRVRDVALVLEHGKTAGQPVHDEPDPPVKQPPPLFWLEVALQPLGGPRREMEEKRNGKQGAPPTPGSRI